MSSFACVIACVAGGIRERASGRAATKTKALACEIPPATQATRVTMKLLVVFSDGPVHLRATVVISKLFARRCFL